MSSIDPAVRAKLIAALEVSDSAQRGARADRIIWMGAHTHRPSTILGSPETLGALQEAADAYREGHFISVILLALSVIEHELVDALVDRSLATYGVKAKEATDLARQHHTLDGALLDRVDKLRLVRSPFVHRKAPDNPHTYGNRYIARKMHPKKLLEEDAQEAFQVMYAVFRALLRPI